MRRPASRRDASSRTSRPAGPRTTSSSARRSAATCPPPKEVPPLNQGHLAPPLPQRGPPGPGRGEAMPASLMARWAMRHLVRAATPRTRQGRGGTGGGACARDTGPAGGGKDSCLAKAGAGDTGRRHGRAGGAVGRREARQSWHRQGGLSRVNLGGAKTDAAQTLGGSPPRASRAAARRLSHITTPRPCINHNPPPRPRLTWVSSTKAPARPGSAAAAACRGAGGRGGGQQA